MASQHEGSASTSSSGVLPQTRNISSVRLCIGVMSLLHLHSSAEIVHIFFPNNFFAIHLRD